MARQSKPTVGEVLAFLGVMVALVMTMWATVCVVATFATNDYRPVMIRAIMWAALSTLIVIVYWRRLTSVGKVMSVVVSVLNLAVLVDAVNRL